MTDVEAGNLYAAYGFACTGVGLLLGFVIDRLGVRRSMLIGCFCSTLYRGICFLSTSRQLMWAATMIFAPIGAAFGVPVLALAVRRYTHRDNRTFAFSFFYSMLCLGCLLGSVLINIVRDFISEAGTTVFGVHISWMRATVGWSTVITAYTFVAAFLSETFKSSPSYLSRSGNTQSGKALKSRFGLHSPTSWAMPDSGGLQASPASL